MEENKSKTQKPMLHGLRCNARQHRIAARQFKEKREQLFLSNSDDCQLQILLTDQEKFNVRSRVSTDSTIAVEDHGLDIEDQFAAYEDTPLPSVWHTVRSAEELEAKHDLSRKIAVFSIPQPHSWSRLQIDYDTYQKLCSQLGIFSAFNDTILHMGWRKQEVEMATLPLKWRCLPGEASCQRDQSWECSYALRYVAKHDREPERPWSFRQFACYEKSFDQESVRIVLVTPPEEIQIDTQLTVEDGTLPFPSPVGVLHARYFQTMLTYWRPYVVWVAGEIATRVSRSSKPDHPRICIH